MADFELDFKIEDLTKEVKVEFEKATERVLYQWGVLGVEGCVNEASAVNFENKNGELVDAVDTGRYRAAFGFITPENARMSGTQVKSSEKNPVKPSDSLLGKTSEKNTVIIANNVEYAKFLEVGTRYIPARHIMKNGIESKRDEMKQRAEKILKGEL